MNFVVDDKGNTTIEGDVEPFTSCTLDWIRAVDHRVTISGNYIAFCGVCYVIEDWDRERFVLNLRLIGDYR